MSERWVEIEAEGGAFKAFVAEPVGAPKAAVVVIQEIFGVNQIVKGKARWLAKEGYLALAPDLFWRLEPGVDITDKSEAEWAKAMDLMKRFDQRKGVEDIQRAIDHCRDAERMGKVGAVGYCLGGLLAYLAVCRTDVDAAVGYYGVAIEQHADEAKDLSTPLMLHVAGKDSFSSPAAVKTMKEALGGKPCVTIYEYPEQDHAFTREGGKNYDAAAAELADARTVAFFGQHLR